MGMWPLVCLVVWQSCVRFVWFRNAKPLYFFLRYVLDALRKVPNSTANSKIFRFGMFALEQFKSRLGKWPQYCANIIQIPHLVRWPCVPLFVFCARVCAVVCGCVTVLDVVYPLYRWFRL